MKYIIELEKIESTDLYRAVGANTLVFDEKGIKNILTPLSEPEIDWSTVTVDTPIYVRDNKTDEWKPRHFAIYKNGTIYAWRSGTTSFSAKHKWCLNWKYAKLAEVEK